MSTSFFSLVSCAALLAVCCIGLRAGEPTDAEMKIVQKLDEIGAVPIDANRAPGIDYGVSLRPVEAELDLARGEVTVVEDDLTSEGLIPWGHRRTYSNLRWYAWNNAGNRWMVTQTPMLWHLSDNSGRKSAFTASGVGMPFRVDNVNGGYKPTFGNLESLRDEGSGVGLWWFTDTTGNRITFKNSNSGPHAVFWGYRDPAGNQLWTQWNSTSTPGQLLRVWQSADGVQANADMEMVYEYNAPAPLISTIISAVEQRVNRGGTMTAVRRVEYDYYLSGDVGGGGGGNVKRATIKAGGSTAGVIGRTYYRYWPTTAGPVGMMKYLVRPKTYARLEAAYGANPDAWTDAVLDAQADRVWTYRATNPGNNRIERQVARGDAGSDAVGIWQFTYFNSNAWVTSYTEDRPNYPDVWKEKIKIERFDLAGNATQIRWIYTNASDQVLLDSTQEVGGSGRIWTHMYGYDSYGRRTMHAYPDAVTGWDDAAYVDIIGRRLRPTGTTLQPNAAFLRDTTGKIETWTYYTSTPATETVAGGVSGLVEHTRVQQGETPAQGPFLQSTSTYFVRNGFPVSTKTERISVPAASTIYPTQTTTPTGGLATTQSYTWNGTTLRFGRRVTSQPIVAAAKNGSGAAVTTTQDFDAWGRPTWSKDADGYIHYRAYDIPTGAVTQAITDANSAKITLPSGWTTPAGGGLHLLASTTVDNLGRPTIFTDPTGVISYYFYNDVSKEYRFYPAWNMPSVAAPLVAAPASQRAPFQIRREYWNSNWREAVTVKVPASPPATPTGNEAATGADVVGLVREQLDVNEHVTSSRAYRAMPATGALPTSFDWGTKDTHYEETVTLYDQRGRPTRVTGADGTRSWTDYDALSRPTASYTGTDDTTKYQVGSTTYDGGGVGNGNVTSTAKLSGSQTLTTSFTYDWRDRLLTSTGPDFIKKQFTRDNLGRVYQQDTYRSNATDSAEATAATSTLGSRQFIEFDEMGRTFRATTTPADAAGSLQTPTVLRYWFDNRGNMVKIQEPNGLLRKAAFDGAGRRWRTSASIDAAESTYALAQTLAGDTVIEQSDGWFNAAGDHVALVTYKRKDGDTTTLGALTSVTAYATAQVWWFDGAHRQVGMADFGRDNDATTRYVLNTDGSIKMHASLGIPSEAAGAARLPNTSDLWQASASVYDTAGRLWKNTDNGGRVSAVEYDLLGRKTKETKVLTDGSP